MLINFTIKYQNILKKMISKLLLENTHWLRPNNDLLNKLKWNIKITNRKNLLIINDSASCIWYFYRC